MRTLFLLRGAPGAGNKKVYITKEEIEVVKVMEKIDKEKLKSMSIIDVEKMMGY